MKRVSRIFFLLLVLLTSSPAASADDVPTILEKARIKYDQFERSVKDITVVQSAKAFTPQGESVTHMKMMKKGKKVRVENTLTIPEAAGLPAGSGSMRTITISDGENAWIFRPGGRKDRLPAEKVGRMPGAGFWWEAVVKNGRVSGLETIRGRECYVIEIAEEQGAPFRKLWLDVSSLVQVQADIVGPNGMHGKVEFSEFHEIAPGFEIPYITRTIAAGRVMSEVIVTSVQKDTGLDDSLFEPDKTSLD